MSVHRSYHHQGEGNIKVLSVRPKVAELVFQLYGRPLHPELFECHETRTIRRADYEAKIDITNAGHVVTWRRDGLTLTEVCAAAHHPLPQKRRLLSYPLRGERYDRVDCRGGITYEVEFELESARPEVFWTFQDELIAGGKDEGILHTFDASGRMALGALSFIHVETRRKSISVRAFHTFPDDYAIVKSRSVFELP
mgnify:CR=1 FL=1